MHPLTAFAEPVSVADAADMGYVRLDDPELIALLEREMLPHAKGLFRFAYKLTNDRDLSNDLVQETFLKACRYARNFRSGSNAKAWLFRILKNAFINEYRRVQRRPAQVSIHDEAASARGILSTLAGRSNTPSTGWVSDEVAQAIRALPVDYRLVVMLCDVEDFSYDEIAEIVGIPVGTVRSRLHRGRNMLRKRLAAYASERGYGETPKAA